MVESHVNESTMHTLHINMCIHTKKTCIGQVHVHWQEYTSHERVHIGVNMELAKDNVTSRRVVASGEQSSSSVG